MKLLANELLLARDRNTIRGGLSPEEEEEMRAKLAQKIIRNVVNSGADVSVGANAGIRSQYSEVVSPNPMHDKLIDKLQEL